jgi:lipopolysaccharide transport system permease protein
VSTERAAAAGTSTIIIEPKSGLASLRLPELWAYRELFYFFVWRDIKVRYKQTVLGAAWAILQPLLNAAVFTIFFGRLAAMPSDGLPYPLFAYSGLLLWTFFAQGVSQAAASLVNSANLITKVYFPRVVVPASSVLSGLIDLAVATPVLIILMLYYRVRPGTGLLLVPVILVMAVVVATGVGIWLAALNVEYRDVRYVVPFLVQIWLFVTPVIYPASLLAPRLQRLGLPAWLWGINPMAGVVEGFRWAMLDAPTNPGSLIAASALTGLALLISGAYYFRRVERAFADVV